MKQLLALVALAATGFAATACTSSGSNTNALSGGGAKGTVGIAMPNQTSSRWPTEGNLMKKKFEDLGYSVDLEFGEDSPDKQVSQIKDMISKHVKAVVIAAIDGNALTSALQDAATQHVTVIAYDRLIRDTRNLDYYATFDNFQVGVLEASFIEQKLGLLEGRGPYTIELFAGSSDDNNTYFFFNGAMAILQPYIAAGKLIVRSGQTDVKQVTTMRWDGANAAARLTPILNDHYRTGHLDAVLSPYDGISRGIIGALKAFGYGGGDRPLPVITGQDAELPSVKSILAGDQGETVFKDVRNLAAQAVTMVDTVAKGAAPAVNDIKSYNNGVKVVPTYLLQPVSVDKTSVQKELVDSGYYKPTDLS
jgi:putative multiple sugar transport system substrate-binding protein